MIHAASNFSHVVALRKLDGHALVTDGVYRYAKIQDELTRSWLNSCAGGSAIHHMLAFSTGLLGLSSYS